MAATSTSTLEVPSNDKTDTLSCNALDATVLVPESACGRLLGRTFSLDELSPLIETIFSKKDEVDRIRSLSNGDAQTLINVLEESLHKPELPLLTQKQCLKLLYRTCGHHALLPKDLYISVLYDKTSSALYRGTYGDVWKGEYRGQSVAVKVIRTYSKDDLRKIMSRFCKEVVTWRFLQHRNVVPMIGVMMSENQFAMVSNWMENGSIVEFIRDRPEVDRIALLMGVVEGLIYLHDHGMIHGDLKGANILVDKDGRARLVDFGLLTIMSDPANRLPSSSNNQAGTVRWMSPELLFPDQFGLEKSRPTRSSDCYALGMVIYETIGGEVPFHELIDIAVFGKLVTKEHPSRGEVFSDSLWEMLEQCWAYQPNDRPGIKDVLGRLRSISDDDGSRTVRSNTMQPPDHALPTDSATIDKTLEAVTEKLESFALEPDAITVADADPGSLVYTDDISSRDACRGLVDGPGVSLGAGSAVVIDVLKRGLEEP